MHIVIAKVDEALFDGDAYSLTVPAVEGEMTILSRHEPLITTLKPGTIALREVAGTEPRFFEIAGGILEVNHDGATVVL